MPSNFIRAVLKVTVSDNIATATSTKFIYNPSSGGALRVLLPVSKQHQIRFIFYGAVLHAKKTASVLLEVFSADRRRMAVLTNKESKSRSAGISRRCSFVGFRNVHSRTDYYR